MVISTENAITLYILKHLQVITAVFLTLLLNDREGFMMLVLKEGAIPRRCKVIAEGKSVLLICLLGDPTYSLLPYLMT